MKFLTPEIEALAKETQSKSLIHQSASCGIFQNYDKAPNKGISEPLVPIKK